VDGRGTGGGTYHPLKAPTIMIFSNPALVLLEGRGIQIPRIEP
jgi:hypothetical protein